MEGGQPDDSLVRAFACHLLAVEASNASVATLRLYDGRHKQFLTFLQQQGERPPFRLDCLNAANVRRAAIWIREHSHGRRNGDSAARALVSTLKTTSAWLVDEGYLDVDMIARVKRPHVSASAQTPFGQTEVLALADAARDTYMASRDLVIIHLLLDTGMRVGGLCSILLEDVNLKERRLELRLKGGRRQALYFGTPERRDGGKTVRELRVWLKQREGMASRHPERHKGMLFLAFDGWPLTETGVRHMMKRLEEVSGVPDVHPHRFRHTYATMYLVRHPGDESGLRGNLGHLSENMFQVYVHLSQEIIAQRAGRVALSEAWLGGDEAAI